MKNRMRKQQEPFTGSVADDVIPAPGPGKPRSWLWPLVLAAVLVLAALMFLGKQEDASDYLERQENFRNSPGYQQIVEDLENLADLPDQDAKFDGIG